MNDAVAATNAAVDAANSIADVAANGLRALDDNLRTMLATRATVNKQVDLQMELFWYATAWWY